MNGIMITANAKCTSTLYICISVFIAQTLAQYLVWEFLLKIVIVYCNCPLDISVIPLGALVFMLGIYIRYKTLKVQRTICTLTPCFLKNKSFNLWDYLIHTFSFILWEPSTMKTFDVCSLDPMGNVSLYLGFSVVMGFLYSMMKFFRLGYLKCC